MATQAELIRRVKDNLYAAAPHEHPFVTTLNGGIGDTDQTLVVAAGDGDSFSKGDEIEIGSEAILVLSVSTDTLTVRRNWRDTAQATHADGVAITKNPRFWYYEIDDVLDSVYDSLEAWGVHSFATDDLTLATNQQFYPLNTTGTISPSYGVLSVYYQADTTLRPVYLPFRYHANLDSNLATFDYGLEVWEWGDNLAGESLYFTYAQVIDGVGALLGRQVEMAVLGATALLLGGTIAPATHDPGARTDRTVAPGQTSRDVRFFQGEFFIRARAEAALLAVERQRAQMGSMKINRSRRWRS